MSPPLRDHDGVVLAFDWATFGAALAGAAIGAAAGLIGSYLTFKASRLNIEHEEREAWRGRQIEAAQAFIASVMATMAELARGLGEGAFDEAGRQQLLAAGMTTLQQQPLVAILFADSPAGKTARDVSNKLAELTGAVQRLPDPSDAGYGPAKAKLDKQIDALDDAFAQLTKLVTNELRPKAA
jgi:hypothetical protein